MQSATSYAPSLDDWLPGGTLHHLHTHTNTYTYTHTLEYELCVRNKTFCYHTTEQHFCESYSRRETWENINALRSPHKWPRGRWQRERDCGVTLAGIGGVPGFHEKVQHDIQTRKHTHIHTRRLQHHKCASANVLLYASMSNATPYPPRLLPLGSLAQKLEKKLKFFCFWWWWFWWWWLVDWLEWLLAIQPLLLELVAVVSEETDIKSKAETVGWSLEHVTLKRKTNEVKKQQTFDR